MKKRIFAVLMTLLCVSLVFALASCGGDGNDGTTECTEHTFGEWETEVFGTCGQETIKVRECSVCGFEEEDVIVEEHKWTEWQVVTELTCTQHGLKTRTCTKCDWLEKDEKEAKGHIWGTEPVETIQEGDCTTDGIYKYKCENCEETKQETEKAVGHDWTEWGTDLAGDEFKKEATCKEAGYTGRECNVCGDAEYEYTEILPHAWNDWVVVGSCAEGATRTRTCANCDEEEEETTAPGEHANIVYEGAKAPTLEEDGSTGTKKCLACGEVLAKAKTIRIMNYALTAAPSTSSWAVVAKYMNDGDMTTGVTGYGNAVRNTIHTLTWTKAVGVEEITLYFSGDATGKNIGGNLSGQLANTNPDTTLTVIIYDENGEEISRFGIPTKDATEYTITLEEQVQISKIDIINANEWDTSKCVNIWEVEVIGTAYLTACDIAGSHDWSDWQTINEAVCNKDGTLTNGLERRTCPVCDGVEENVIVASHTFGAWDETGVNCETGGTRTKTCSVCGYVLSETVAAGEHVETEVQGAKEPTFEEDGSTGALVCTKCGTTIEEAKVISKLYNAALDAEVTTDALHWHVIGDPADPTGKPSHLPKVNDGDRETAIASSSKNYNQKVTLTFAEAIKLKELIVVCNGKGNYGIGSTDTVTNFKVDITVTFYDAEGNKISEQTQNSADVTELKYVPDGDKAVKSVSISYFAGYTSNSLYLWEVEAIAGGEVVENKAE